MSYWIVIVDDEPLSLTNARNILRARDMRVSCLRSGRDLLNFVEKNIPDLILLDILMPEMDGFETYRNLRRYEETEGRSHIPVIFVTGENDSETERRGLKAGASDFVRKPFDEDVLIKRIKNSITNSKTIESLTEEATQDKLTGFWNKTSGTEKLSALCERSSGALMIMDLDNFKLVNDLFGHDTGDKILVAFSEIVRENVRSDDVICRLGGDEFTAFFPDVTNEEAVAALSHRLNGQLARKADLIMGRDHGIPLGISIGAAFTFADPDDYQILFRYADSALYEVKRNGKHSYGIYDPEAFTVDTEVDPDRELSRIIQIMSERGEGRGALLLGQEAFSWNYRFIERFLMRYGGVAARVLFTLSSEENGIIFLEMVSEFGNILTNTLRKVDIILRWKQNQYFVVLPQLTENDFPKVTERIMNAWENAGFNDRLTIKYTMSMLAKDTPHRDT